VYTINVYIVIATGFILRKSDVSSLASYKKRNNHQSISTLYCIVLSIYCFFVLYSLFILLTCREVTETLYIGKQLPRPAFGDTEILSVL